MVFIMFISVSMLMNLCLFQDGVAVHGCLSQLMEEQLLLQQQQMEDDQRWLEQEERLLVLILLTFTSSVSSSHSSAHLCLLTLLSPFPPA